MSQLGHFRWSGPGTGMSGPASEADVWPPGPSEKWPNQTSAKLFLPDKELISAMRSAPGIGGTRPSFTA